MSQQPPIIHFDYDFSPYGAKIRSALTLTQTPFSRAKVPTVLPRPLLEKLGVTHRRIPVTAIGKDVYVDTALILSVLQSGKLNNKPLPTSTADKAYEVFGDQVFKSALSVIPVEALTPEFVKDRLTIFPFLARDDYASLRPSGLADWRNVLRVVEEEFLTSEDSFVGGASTFGVADVNISFSVKWVLEMIGVGKEAGFDEGNFPRVYAWLKKIPQPQFEEADEETAVKAVLGAGYWAKDIGVDVNDYLGLKKGDEVGVENIDSESGKHVQRGRLVGLDVEEVVVEVETGVRVHFPRRGYVVKKV